MNFIRFSDSYVGGSWPPRIEGILVTTGNPGLFLFSLDSPSLSARDFPHIEVVYIIENRTADRLALRWGMCCGWALSQLRFAIPRPRVDPPTR